jgi:hypothetical protein
MMQTEAFNAAMARLEEVLLERWELERQDPWSFAFSWKARSVPVSCYAQINPDMEAFIFRVLVPVRLAAEQRPLLAEFMHRVNYAQPIGNWAIDLDTGDTRFKNGVYFQGSELTEALIRNVIESALVFVHHDIVGIMKLQAGGTVEEAIADRG